MRRNSAGGSREREARECARRHNARRAMSDGRMLREALGTKISLSGSKKWVHKNLLKLIRDRDYDERLLRRLASMFEVSCCKRPDFVEFYYWLRDKDFTARDVLAYRMARRAARKVGHVDAGVSPNCFAGSGGLLLRRLRDWVGRDSGNTDRDLLLDYFVVVFSKLEPGFAYSPAATLRHFGWTVFLEQFPKRYGSLAQYRKPSKSDERKFAKMRKHFVALESERKRLLLAGDVAGMDALGRRVARQGLEDAVSGV